MVLEFLAMAVIGIGIIQEVIVPVGTYTIDAAAPYFEQGIDTVKGIVN
jgi:hypothetical protein